MAHLMVKRKNGTGECFYSFGKWVLSDYWKVQLEGSWLANYKYSIKMRASILKQLRSVEHPLQRLDTNLDSGQGIKPKLPISNFSTQYWIDNKNIIYDIKRDDDQKNNFCIS